MLNSSRHSAENKKGRNYLVKINPTMYLIPKPRNRGQLLKPNDKAIILYIVLNVNRNTIFRISFLGFSVQKYFLKNGL